MSSPRIDELEREVARLRMELREAKENSQLDLSTRVPTHMRTPSSAAGPDSNYVYTTLLYRVDEDDAVAYISLNRPEHLNVIIWPMPFEIRHAVQRANEDPRVHSIVLTGEGRGFCSGYDLKHYAESPRGTVAGSQKMPWDPYSQRHTVDFAEMKECTDCYMSLFHSYKPTIAMVHGYALAGGSDIALCCDLVVMAEQARIGYPPARMWGSPTTHMWTARLGGEKAKRMLLTGDIITGKEAAQMGLVLKAVPAEQLKATVKQLTDRMKGVPCNQLFFNKLVCNHAMSGNSLASTQQLATLMDGATRHTPEGLKFQLLAQREGFQAAIATLRADTTEGRQRAQLPVAVAQSKL